MTLQSRYIDDIGTWGTTSVLPLAPLATHRDVGLAPPCQGMASAHQHEEQGELMDLVMLGPGPSRTLHNWDACLGTCHPPGCLACCQCCTLTWCMALAHTPTARCWHARETDRSGWRGGGGMGASRKGGEGTHPPHYAWCCSTTRMSATTTMLPFSSTCPLP